MAFATPMAPFSRHFFFGEPVAPLPAASHGITKAIRAVVSAKEAKKEEAKKEKKEKKAAKKEEAQIEKKEKKVRSGGIDENGNVPIAKVGVIAKVECLAKDAEADKDAETDGNGHMKDDEGIDGGFCKNVQQNQDLSQVSCQSVCCGLVHTYLQD